MIIKKSSIIILLQMLLICNLLKGQETIMTDYSAVYVEKLVAIAKENNPNGKVYEHQVNIAKNMLNGERTSWVSSFSFSYLARSNSSSVDIVNPQLLTGYQFGVSLNPGTLFKIPFNIKTAKEQVKISYLAKEAYDLQLESDVKSRYLLYLQSLSALRLQNKIVLDAESIFKDMKIKYERSEITFLDYNNASMSLSTAYLTRIQAETSLIAAKVSLEALLAKKLEEIK
ncbi:TolC family protein [Arcticibacter svalbardensis]|uniref:TolC family protein n=1 Tax=Arcticibacter svalbardensis TaxID=1288027 RepID=UPI00058C70FD|nr:TolC family protein [Arcticibacter svalbardensis]